MQAGNYICNEAPSSFAVVTMANTFSQIYLHFVFAVQGRQSLIPKPHKDELHRYLTSLVQARNAKLLAIHCMPDHANLLVGFPPAVLISGFVKEIKVQSNEFINNKQWVLGRFAWQEGYGVFSYSRSQVHQVAQYILNQEQHHHKRTFREEYLGLLEKFAIEFDDRHLFDWVE